MSFAESIAAHQRLITLRLLAAANGYTLNDSVIAGGLMDFGLAASRDQVRTMLAWLEEQGLIKRRAPTETALIAVITDRGLDVANGVMSVPGVQRPKPTSLVTDALRAAAGLPPES